MGYRLLKVDKRYLKAHFTYHLQLIRSRYINCKKSTMHATKLLIAKFQILKISLNKSKLSGLV
jgi:hypothetical protein